MPETQEPYGPDERRAAIDRIVEGQQALMHLLASAHVAEFLEIGVTMPQAKLLYLVVAAARLRMSELAARLAVSLSTVSGLVERLVEAGLVDRHDDPADRRQVVVTPTETGAALLERFNELNSRQLRALLWSLDDGALATVGRAIRILTEAAAAAERVTT